MSRLIRMSLVLVILFATTTVPAAAKKHAKKRPASDSLAQEDSPQTAPSPKQTGQSDTDLDHQPSLAPQQTLNVKDLYGAYDVLKNHPDQKVRERAESWQELTKSRKWQDSTGQYSIDARFASFDSESKVLTLENHDGKQITLSIGKVSEKDFNAVLAIAKLTPYIRSDFQRSRSLGTDGTLTRPTLWREIRGIKWGEDIANVRGMQQIKRYSTRRITYHRPSDEMTFDNVKLDTICYDFYDGKFYSFDMIAAPHSYQALVSAVTKLFGRGTPTSSPDGFPAMNWTDGEVLIGVINGTEVSYAEVKCLPLARKALAEKISENELKKDPPKNSRQASVQRPISNAEVAERKRLLADIDKRRPSIELDFLDDRNKELRRLIERQEMLHNDRDFGDLFSGRGRQIATEIFNSIPKQKAELDKGKDGNSDPAKKRRERLAELEQERRRVLTKYPLTGDPTFVEEGGGLFTQSELDHRQAEQQKAEEERSAEQQKLKDEHGSPKAAVKGIVQALKDKGTIRSPVYSGTFADPRDKEHVAVAYSGSIKGKPSHFYFMLKKKGQYWYTASGNDEGFTAGAVPNGWRQVHLEGK